jgi:xanthine/uracil/vitamin C permease (AzgA family)
VGEALLVDRCSIIRDAAITATANAAVAETTKGGLWAKEPIKIAPIAPAMAIEAVALAVLA